MTDFSDAGAWREELPKIKGIEWVHPTIPPDAFAHDDHRASWFFSRDLLGLSTADMALVVFDHTVQHGTTCEVGWLAKAGTPMICVCPQDLRSTYVFALGMFGFYAIFDELDEAIEALRYMVS
jgi:nucleoside 2-deoxyribosyltransferase